MTKRKTERPKEESQTQDAKQLLSSFGQEATEANVPEAEEEMAAKETALDARGKAEVVSTIRPQPLLKVLESVTEPLHPIATKQLLERHRGLEARMVQGKRQYAEALKSIIEERTYRSEGFDSLEEYMVFRWASTRKTAYQIVTWLKAVEFLESQGVTDPLQRLSPEATLVFRRWENRPEVFYLAYQQVAERGEQPTQQRLEQESDVQADYLREADHTPDLTQEEYRAYQRLKPLPCTYSLDKAFKSAAELLEECLSMKKRPPLKAITQCVRGNDLLALVQQLEPLGADIAKLDALKKEKIELETQKRDQSRMLTDKIRQLAADIAKAEGDEAEEESEDEDGKNEDGKNEDSKDEDSKSETGKDEDGKDEDGKDEDNKEGDGTRDSKAVTTKSDPVVVLNNVVTSLEQVALPQNLSEMVEKKADVLPLLTKVSVILDTLKLALEAEADDARPVP